MMGQVNWYRHFNKTKNDDALARYDAQAYRCFGVLEGQLNAKPNSKFILGGERPSAVDFHTYAWVRLSTFAQLNLESYPSIQGWLKTVAELPAVIKAYETIPKGESA
jgi:glutathione S-transferase